MKLTPLLMGTSWILDGRPIFHTTAHGFVTDAVERSVRFELERKLFNTDLDLGRYVRQADFNELEQLKAEIELLKDRAARMETLLKNWNWE